MENKLSRISFTTVVLVEMSASFQHAVVFFGNVLHHSLKNYHNSERFRGTAKCGHFTRVVQEFNVVLSSRQ